MQLLNAGSRNVSGLAFAPDSRALAIACVNHIPQLWELPATGLPIPLADKRTYSTNSFTFSADASVVGWLGGAQRLEYDRASGTTREVTLLPEGERLNSQIVCGPDSRLIVRSFERGIGFRIRAFRVGEYGDWTEAWTIGPANVAGYWLGGSSQANRFFTDETSREGQQRFNRLVARSTLTGAGIEQVDTPTTSVRGFAVKPDGSAMVTFKDSSLYFWRPGEKVQKVRTGTLKHYRDLAFHPDGRHLLAGNNDTTARLIDTETWEVVRQFTWDIGRLTAVAVSPDGALAAAGGTKGRVVVWDLDV